MINECHLYLLLGCYSWQKGCRKSCNGENPEDQVNEIKSYIKMAIIPFKSEKVDEKNSSKKK